MCICCAVTRAPIHSLFASVKGSFQPISTYCRYTIPPWISITNPQRRIGMDSDTEVQLSYWQSNTVESVWEWSIFNVKAQRVFRVCLLKKIYDRALQSHSSCNYFFFAVYLTSVGSNKKFGEIFWTRTAVNKQYTITSIKCYRKGICSVSHSTSCTDIPP